MKKTAIVFLIMASAALVTGCHHSRDISFDGHSITLHAGGEPAATITSRGSFSVGSKLIDVSPGQRQLLIRYYNGVVAIHRDTETMKNAGLAMAGNAAKTAGHSIESAVGADSSSAIKAEAKSMHTTGERMREKGIHLCSKLDKVEQLQTTLATQIAAFEPYAGLDPAPGVHCV